MMLGDSEVSANLYCNSRTSVWGRLRDYLRLLMKRSVYRENILASNTKRSRNSDKKKYISMHYKYAIYISYIYSIENFRARGGWV